VKKERRSGLYETLQAHSLRAGEMALLKGSGSLGQRMTARDALSRQMRESKAGISVLTEEAIAVGKSARLTGEARAASGMDSDDDEEEDEDEDEDDEEDAAEPSA
jgi:hypothetical protein